MNIAGLVILYNPDESVVRNIETYQSLIQRLYIIDNSENEHGEIIERLLDLPGCIYMHDGENKGVAVRLNQACSLAKLDGFSALLTMDQDSFFSPPNIESYFNCVINYSGKNTVAMFGIQFENSNIKSGSCDSEKVIHLITSGSIINLDLLEIIGGFDEMLFIDEVDSEYCYRACLKGFQVIQFKNIFLDHNLGKRSYHKSFKTFKKTSRTLHPPIRLYYMTRNFLYLKSKYQKTLPDAIFNRKEALLNKIKNNILYNSKRIMVCKYILRGYFDFRRRSMGKYRG